MSTHVLTVCTLRTLPHALVLRESLGTHQPDWPLHIGLVDPIEAIPGALRPLARYLDVRTMGLPDFGALTRQYTRTEFANLTRPFFAQHLLAQYADLDRLVFLAPQTQVFAPLRALEDRLTTAALLLTPRLTAPLAGAAGRAEKEFLNAGTFESGCWALRRSETATAFLDWWADRLARKGWLDLCQGFGSDQLWLDLVPAYFDGVNRLTESGYAVGPRNRHEHPLRATATGFRFGDLPLTSVLWRDEQPLVALPRTEERLWRRLHAAYLTRLNAYAYASLREVVPGWGLADQAPKAPAWRRRLAQPFRRLVETINTCQPYWLYP